MHQTQLGSAKTYFEKKKLAPPPSFVGRTCPTVGTQGCHTYTLEYFGHPFCLPVTPPPPAVTPVPVTQGEWVDGCSADRKMILSISRPLPRLLSFPPPHRCLTPITALGPALSSFSLLPSVFERGLGQGERGSSLPPPPQISCPPYRLSGEGSLRKNFSRFSRAIGGREAERAERGIERSRWICIGRQAS